MEDANSGKKKLAVDKKMNAPFISGKRESFLFLDDLEAAKFRNENDGVKLVDVSNFGVKAIQSICYAAGATSFWIVGGSDEHEKDHESLDPSSLNRQYYNAELNSCLTLYLRTKNAKLLPRFAACKYIVAVNIDKNREQYLLYASARKKSDQAGRLAILAFSDLKEFNAWKNKYGPKYKPLQVDFDGLERIGGKHGFLMNPDSSKLFISPDLIRAIRKSITNEIEEGKMDEENA